MGSAATLVLTPEPNARDWFAEDKLPEQTEQTTVVISPPSENLLEDKKVLIEMLLDCDVLECLIPTLEENQISSSDLTRKALKTETFSEKEKDSVLNSVSRLRKVMSATAIDLTIVNSKSTHYTASYYLGHKNKEKISPEEIPAIRQVLEESIKENREKILREKNVRWLTVTLPDGQIIRGLMQKDCCCLQSLMENPDKGVSQKELDEITGGTSEAVLHRLALKLRPKNVGIINVLNKDKDNEVTYFPVKIESSANVTQNVLEKVKEIIPPKLQDQIRADAARRISSIVFLDAICHVNCWEKADKDAMTIFKNCLPASLDFNLESDAWPPVYDKTEGAEKKRSQLRQLRECFKGYSEEAFQKREALREWFLNDLVITTIEESWNKNKSLSEKEKIVMPREERQIISFCAAFQNEGMELTEVVQTICRHFSVSNHSRYQESGDKILVTAGAT